jgi:hypothetical protein
MGRKRIEISAQPIRFNRDITCRSALSTFENGMLDEVANSVKFGSFVSGTAANPDPGSH